MRVDIFEKRTSKRQLHVALSAWSMRRLDGVVGQNTFLMTRSMMEGRRHCLMVLDSMSMIAVLSVPIIVLMMDGHFIDNTFPLAIVSIISLDM